MEITTTQSNRGKCLLVLDGFTFSKQKVLKNGEVFWRCTKKITNCGAKVFTIGADNTISGRELNHNHKSDSNKVHRQILSSS